MFAYTNRSVTQLRKTEKKEDLCDWTVEKDISTTHNIASLTQPPEFERTKHLVLYQVKEVGLLQMLTRSRETYTRNALFVRSQARDLSVTCLNEGEALASARPNP